MSLLAQIAIFLAAAVIAIPIFRRFKLGSVLGYLAAGIIIGPDCLGLIRRIDNTMHVAEFGIVLLMFVIGLELQPSRLWVLRKPIFGLGSGQVLVTTAAVGSAAHFGFGATWQASLVIGFGLSMSSTALALQLLAERGQLNSQYGRSAFSILLFQDMAVMPALALMPLLALAAARPSAPSGIWLVLKLAVVLAAVVIGGRYILRPMLRIVAETRVTEAFTAAGLLVVIGTALLVSQVGLSMSLGAFLAGVLARRQRVSPRVGSQYRALQGLVVGTFFHHRGDVGESRLARREALADSRPDRWLHAVEGGRPMDDRTLVASSKAAAHGLAFSLPSGGEFAFVLFGLAASLGVMDTGTVELLVLAVTASMILSPVFMIFRDAFFTGDRNGRAAVRHPDELYPKVIIAGFGRFGQIVGRILRAKKIPFTALEASQTQVDFLRRFGNQIFYGDASRLELLRAAHAENAKIFVVAIDDVEASVRTVELIRKHFPHLKIFARARNRTHVFRLLDLGVDYVIRETLVSSLEMSAAVLEALGASKPQAVESIRRFRIHDEATLLRQQAVKDDEKKLVQSGRESAEQLLHLFETDTEHPEDEVSREPA